MANTKLEYVNTLTERVVESELVLAELVLEEVMRALPIERRIDVMEYIARNCEAVDWEEDEE